MHLPTGIFYAQGVKANVPFFDRRPGAKDPWTRTVWIYDLRTNKHFTLETKRMTRADLDEFVACYRPGDPIRTSPASPFPRCGGNRLVPLVFGGPTLSNLRWAGLVS